MRMRSLVALFVCAVSTRAAELPVRTVVLYKHGVGYFERSGALGPGESARLDFKADEMNDVLKSLTINDQGGKVTGLRYDSSVPLDQKLTEFPFHINNGEPLSAVIDQLKGARIEMEFGQQKTAGAIVSARLVAGDKDRPEREQLTLLMDSGELRNVDLAAATAIRFADPKLQLQLKDYLAAVTGARSKEKRSVYIDSTDSKSRNVRAAGTLCRCRRGSPVTGSCSMKAARSPHWRVGPSSTIRPVRTGPTCACHWFRENRFHSSANSIRRSSSPGWERSWPRTGLLHLRSIAAL